MRRLIGDEESALAQAASFRAGAGLSRQNRRLCRLFHLLQRLSVYLEFVAGDPNRADFLSRRDSD